MPIATTTALAIGLGAAGSLAGGAIAARGAGRAAKTQAQAALSAAELERQSAQEALQFQKDVFAKQQENIAPWLAAGRGGLGSLANLLGISGGGAGFGSLLQPFGERFAAPTSVTEQNDPGFQFRLEQGQRALENSAAARGGLLSGNTARALQEYGQNYASNEYQNVYGRALGEYEQRYNQFQQNQANQFNRLASMAGLGQVAAGQLNTAGNYAAGNVGNILLGSAGQIGSALQNAGAARASGYLAQGNIFGGLAGGLGSLAMLAYLNRQGSLGTPGITPSQWPAVG